MAGLPAQLLPGLESLRRDRLRSADPSRLATPAAFRKQAYLAYDEQPAVTDAIRALGHPYNDVPNLYVCDGGSFPSGGVVNPTSTVTALALRCARRPAARFASDM